MKCYSKVFFTEIYINKFILKKGLFLFITVFSVDYYLSSILSTKGTEKRIKISLS